MRLKGLHSARFSALSLIVVAAAAAAAGTGTAHAQNVPGAGGGAASPASSSAPKALARVIAGAKAYKAGKNDQAVSALSGALAAGGLGSTDLAKALYYRGLAYQKKKMFGEAIADLTSAIWLKNGLPDKDRQVALNQRSAAYRSAGIQEPGAVVAQSAGAPAAAAAPTNNVATPSRPASSAGVATAASNKKTASPHWAADSLQVAPGGASAPAKSGGTTSDPIAGVGKFFTNLFGGGGSPAPAPAAKKVTSTGSTGAIGTGQGASPGAGANSAVSGWTSQNSAPAASPAARTVVAKAPVLKPTAPIAKRPAAFTGRYRIRVAAVRSREEASRVASVFQQNHRASLGGRSVEIESEAFGNMGTFYNVQVGPFARAKDYKALCSAARAAGYDCLVIKK